MRRADRGDAARPLGAAASGVAPGRAGGPLRAELPPGARPLRPRPDRQRGRPPRAHPSPRRRPGCVADGALPALYCGARVLAFPSFSEGFGLPPLEMQACGGAVLASTADAVAEVLAGSPAQLIDPRDEDGWHAALHAVCADD